MISQQIVPCNPKMIKGLNDFRILVTESDIFIDKTLLIKDIIDS